MLPIAERELRVAARQPRTYRSRLLMAGIGVLIFAWMVWLLLWHGRRFSGSDLFQVVSWIAFVNCLFAGVALTADSLSSEKRENTIGLLFLTDLRGYEIVLGKLTASSVNCFFGLLALFPVLAIPLIMGGVQFTDFCRVVLSLSNTLYLSLSVGLLISTVSKQSLRATSLGLLVMAVASFGLSGFAELVRVHYQRPEIARALESVSPFFTHTMAFSNAGWLRTNYFWPSLLTTHLIGWACLGLSCWILPRVWKERAGGRKTFQWRERWRRWKFGVSKHSGGFRERILDYNPFLWLASRDRLSLPTIMLFTLGFVGVTTWIAWKVGAQMSGPAKPMGGYVFTLFWATALLHLVILTRIVMAATHKFAEDRKSGALELLLSTPMRAGQIVRGQWLALLRQMWGPICAVVLVHGLFLWGLLELFAAEDFGGRSGRASDILKAILQHGLTGGGNVEWHFIFMLVVVFAALIWFFTDWIALGWVGMWMGLRAKRGRNAPWAAMALVLIPPIPFFTLGVMALDYFSFLWTEFELLYIGLNMALGLVIVNNVILSVWAWRRLRRDFRVAVTDRFLFLQRKRTWRQRGKIVLRFALALVAAFVLFELWKVEEDWRGRRAWTRFQREAEAKGGTLDWKSVIPATVPSDQNFGEAPIFAPLFDFDRTTRGGIRFHGSEGYSKLQQINLQGPARGGPVYVSGGPVFYPPGVAAGGLGDWRNVKTADFKFWQNHFRSLPQFPKPAATNDPAADVLMALGKFDSDLEAMNAACRRPYSRFPIDYSKGTDAIRHHVPIVQGIAGVVQLRALASLSVGRSGDALRDLQLIFRFAEALGQEPFIISHQGRSSLLGSAIQIIWEGLAARRWSGEHLAQLEAQLGKLDLLSDYQTVVRGEVFLQIGAWERFRSVLQGTAEPEPSPWPKRWPALRLFYPPGWTFHRQIRIYRASETLLGTLAGPKQGAVSFEEMREVWDSIEKNAAFFGNRGLRYTFEGVAFEYLRTQTALNLARIACGLERFRQAHGEYPDRLDALVPPYLVQVPGDVVNGEPMTYQRTDTGEFVLSRVLRATMRYYNSAEPFHWRYPKK